MQCGVGFGSWEGKFGGGGDEVSDGTIRKGGGKVEKIITEDGFQSETDI